MAGFHFFYTLWQRYSFLKLAPDDHQHVFIFILILKSTLYTTLVNNRFYAFLRVSTHIIRSHSYFEINASNYTSVYTNIFYIKVLRSLDPKFVEYSKASINAVFCARKIPRCSKTFIRRLKLCNGV